MDLVALAILVVVPLLAASTWLVRVRHAYGAHKRLQIIISLALVVVLTVFEAEVRRRDWRPAAALSPYYASWLYPVFYVHLSVAVSATLLWCSAAFAAWRWVPRPPRPGTKSHLHRRLGRAAALAMVATAITGWTFYWIAFLA
jgi:hypothetical protein